MFSAKIEWQLFKLSSKKRLNDRKKRVSVNITLTSQSRKLSVNFSVCRNIIIVLWMMPTILYRNPSELTALSVEHTLWAHHLPVTARESITYSVSIVHIFVDSHFPSSDQALPLFNPNPDNLLWKSIWGFLPQGIPFDPLLVRGSCPPATPPPPTHPISFASRPRRSFSIPLQRVRLLFLCLPTCILF